MFTGIVEELGTVRAFVDGRLEILAAEITHGLEIGASVAVNGCCLTAVEIGDVGFAADVVAETLSRTNLGDLSEGSPVNLERPMRVDGRLDGHIVQGHVDATGEVRSPAPDLFVSAPDSILGYLVEKGSITVDGVSLTVAGIEEGAFRVAVIPHTAAVTTLGARRPGERVNLEVDVVAKYVERLLARTGRIQG
jgi:riboflavin synthase